MKTLWKSLLDNWTVNGSKINSPENLALLQASLEKQGPILLKHWFYRGARGPEYKIFDDYDELVHYLDNECFAGDAIDIWSLLDICKDDQRLLEGKCPDETGSVPLGGAY